MITPIPSMQLNSEQAGLPTVFATGVLDEKTKGAAAAGSQLAKDIAIAAALLGKAMLVSGGLTEDQRATYQKGLIALSDWSGLSIGAFNV